MRVLLVHNRYREPGGEDVVCDSESELLRTNGHDVTLWTVDNKDIRSGRALGLTASAVWSRKSARKMRRLIAQGRPEIVHCHNTFPLLSPSLYYTCADEGVPIVQTLHNFRLVCPAATLFREGKPCEECVSRAYPFSGLVHACYRGSRVQTAVAGMVTSVHWALRTYQSKVSAYIALTEGARAFWSRAGLPAERLHVKPNFLVADPGAGEGDGVFCLFVGRLQPEKGIATVLRAWDAHSPPLKIVGDGALRPVVEEAARRSGNISYLGRIPRGEVLALMKRSAALVFPSEWYEGFPMAIVEGFACGLPIVASRLGAAAELVADGVNGLLFTPGDPTDLAAKTRWLWSHPEERRRMGRNARRAYEERFTAERNHEQLLRIYAEAAQTRLDLVSGPGGT